MVDVMPHERKVLFLPGLLQLNVHCRVVAVVYIPGRCGIDCPMIPRHITCTRA